MAKGTKDWPAGFDYVVWGLPRHDIRPAYKKLFVHDDWKKDLWNIPGALLLLGSFAALAVFTFFPGVLIPGAGETTGLGGLFLFFARIIAGVVLISLAFNFFWPTGEELIYDFDDKVEEHAKLARTYGRLGVDIKTENLDDFVSALNGFATEAQAYVNQKMAELRKRKDSIGWQIGIWVAMLFGFACFALALIIDYAILYEFWASNLADEFGAVPEGLQNSVIFKAAQVVVAALAFHFFWKIASHAVQRTTVTVIFLLTALLLLGLGFFQAVSSIPGDKEIIGLEVSQERVGLVVEERNPEEEVDPALKALGLAEEEEPEEPRTQTAAAENVVPFATVEASLWIMTYGVIFLVVTGVAAMSFNFALRAANSMFGYVDDEGWRQARKNRRNVELRFYQFHQVRRSLENPIYRQSLFQAAIAEYRKQYVEGLEESKDTHSISEKMETFNASVSDLFETRWSLEKIEESMLTGADAVDEIPPPHAKKAEKTDKNGGSGEGGSA